MLSIETKLNGGARFGFFKPFIRLSFSAAESGGLLYTEKKQHKKYHHADFFTDFLCMG